MCIFSTCGQMIYGLLMVACIALTATATFTSSWRTSTNPDGGTWHIGIMSFNCITTKETPSCNDWWNNAPNYLRATTVMMCLALAIEIIALAWNLFTCIACCCKKWLIHPLSIFAFFITSFLLASIITYAVGSKHLLTNSSLGYSFWIAVGALILSAANVVVGGITVCLGKHHL